MKVQELFSQAQFLNETIKSKTKELNNLAELSESIGGSIAKVGSIRHITDKTGEIAASITDISQELSQDIANLLRIKYEIIKLIGRLPETSRREWRLVLEMRYVRLMVWEDISDELCYSVQHLHRIHNKAVSELEKIANDP